MLEKSRFNPSNKSIKLSLFITGFATSTRLIISSLLLIEIGITFGTPVGLTGQIVTAASIVAIIAALIMGILIMRYTSRPLLLSGILFFSISAVGCFLAPDFTTMLLCYSIAGIGDAMVFPMLGTIIGETLPSEERSKALGLINAGQPISFVIGSPIVAYIASNQGWRMSFLFYMLPIVTISFLITYFGIPKTRSKKEDNTASGNLSGYKGVISNKSALSCLLGATIFQASMFTSWTYVISYLRQSFMISQSWTTILISLMAVCAAIGSLTVGRIVSKYGKKLATTFLSLLLGLSVIILYNSGNLWVSLAVIFPWAYVAGAGYVSGDVLTLDQVPQYRGTLMSLNMVARSIGITLGGILGGSLLILFDYNIFGIIMGVIGILAATNYHLFTLESD